MMAEPYRAPEQQLSRLALLYLLAAFFACNALLALFLPWWLLPVAVACFAGRLLVFSGRVSFPSSWLRTVLVLLAGAALYAQYRFTVSLDVFVMLLLVGFSLKLLEIHQKADAQLLLYIAFFVLMTVFLFEQSAGYAVLVFLAVLLVLSAMVAVHSDDVLLLQLPWQPLRKGVQLFAFSLPVMLFMFAVMPRLPPLWSMPLQTQQGKTGMSDSMSPGDIASLAQSSELVFRATFVQAVPSRNDLYWYGMYLDHFDGVRWIDSCADCQGYWVTPSASASDNGSPYQVILEPNGHKWLYLLQPSVVKDSAMKRNRDGIARYVDDVNERIIYNAWYVPSEKNSNSQLDRARYLALPRTGNPAARQLAQQWRQDSGTDQAVVQKALDFYHASFSYTLQPPPLQRDRIDAFLFDTRSGFCEHFAGSFVFLMRAAGIPARVAIGYMGGEVNEAESFIAVRQYDAHAWAEVWFPGEGWRRVDPTAAVAPERINLGFAGAYATDTAFAASAGISALRRFALINQLRLEFDRFDYLWSRWVLGYGGDQQQVFLRWFGLVSPLRIALWAGGVVVLAFVLLCVFLYWREWHTTKEHPATRCYRQLCHAYSALGVQRENAETPLQYAGRIREAGLPFAEKFCLLSAVYYEWAYEATLRDVVVLSEGFVWDCRRLYWRLLLLSLRPGEQSIKNATPGRE